MSTQDIYYTIGNRISNSFLSAFKRELLGKGPMNGSSTHMRFGRGFHTALFEPQKFSRSEHSGKEISHINGMVNACREYLPKEIWNGLREHEYYYRLMQYLCKGKMDLVLPKESCRDFKTTGMTQHGDFLRQAIEFDYNRQAAWYLDVPAIKAAGINKFVIHAVSKVKPYAIFNYELDREDPIVQAGREEYLFLLEQLAKSKYHQRFLNAA